MTSKQQKFYLQSWLQIVHLQGWKGGLDVRRKALHAELGLPESSKTWTNAQFNKWLESTAHLRDQVDTRNRSRENMLHALKEAAYAMFEDEYDANLYVGKLLRDRFDATDLDALTDRQLQQLLMTVKERAKAHSANHETPTPVGT